MESITIDDVLYLLLTVLLPVLARYAWQFLYAKISDCEQAKAIDAVFSAVGFVGQTYVDSLKQSGDFDYASQQKALEKAKDAALAIMDASARKWLEKAVVDVDEWLTVQIENAIKHSKRGI